MYRVANCLRSVNLHTTPTSTKVNFSKTLKAFLASSSSDNITRESIFTDEHVELRRTLNKIIEKDINPYVDEWEAACRFPAHDVFKKLGSAGLLGLNKPTEYGGMALDFTFTLAMAEELGIWPEYSLL
jgi:citronellyl-CoA dehydrogenase